MGARVAVLKERRPGEHRAAATPETVRKLTALGLAVAIEQGAGEAASYPDEDYRAASADVVIDAAAALAGADILLAVRAPDPVAVKALKPGAVVIGLLDPYENDALRALLTGAQVTAFAMELVPRITRAQAMDVLSSQANLAGYRAVIEAAEAYGRALPMMMTAAGTVAAAKVFVMGAGVAGLQAIATARRLGAVVTATDVRPAAKEQVESLGAKFIAVEDEEFRAAETAAGYAKEMSAEYQVKQAALVSDHIKKQDIVITTALIPGRPAPRLVSAAQLQSMRPGAVVVDLAVERGGNVEGVKRDAIAEIGGVKVVGFENLPSRIAADASNLYARNLLSFVGLLVNAEGALALNLDDEILKGAMITHAGEVANPAFKAA
jgi:H+-translocating NAD(P) transhydrogenase subunit alpha